MCLNNTPLAKNKNAKGTKKRGGKSSALLL
jgi:hypothetical protein